MWTRVAGKWDRRVIGELGEGGRVWAWDGGGHFDGKWNLVWGNTAWRSE